MRSAAEAQRYEFLLYDNDSFSISIDETTTQHECLEIIHIFAATRDSDTAVANFDSESFLDNIPSTLTRTSDFLTHPVFNTHHSETEMMRYLKVWRIRISA